MFGGLQTIEDSKSIQLSSPLLERDILDIPHSQLNITYPVDPPTPTSIFSTMQPTRKCFTVSSSRD